jgi:putative membrane protein
MNINKIIHWILSAVAVMVAAYILRGVSVDGFFPALVVALVLGIMNFFVRPLIIIFTLPINILTLGLFTFVINALLIELTSAIVPGFHVNGFLWALLFSMVLAVVNFALHSLVRDAD